MTAGMTTQRLESSRVSLPRAGLGALLAATLLAGGLIGAAHVEQTGLQAEITGVVIDGWGKGNPVKGQYTEIQCEHDGVTTDCWRGTLAITEGASEGRPAPADPVTVR